MNQKQKRQTGNTEAKRQRLRRRKLVGLRNTGLSEKPGKTEPEGSI